MDNNMPKLSVAENKYGEIVHIRDVDEERRKKEDFTCPICNGKVKARAITDTACVQPHFYHVEGKCGGESEGHWMFKNWLLKEETEFTVQSKDKNEKYTVESIELEKAYDTNFGKYIPDITVNTKEGKTILFEIRFSNRKTNDEYLLKWQELGLDVVEVDAKKLMDEDYNQEKLTFDIMYSDGKSYVITYKGRDRKIFDYKSELKRQDKLNYKARWMQLDWIYIEFKRLYNDFTEENQEKIIESFTALETKDKEFVFDSVKKHKLGSLKDKLSKILDNDLYYGIWKLYEDIVFGLKEIGSPLVLSLNKGREYFTLKVGGNIEYEYFQRKKYGKIDYLSFLELKITEEIKNMSEGYNEILYQLEEINKYIKNEKEIRRLGLTVGDVIEANIEKLRDAFYTENFLFKIYLGMNGRLYFYLKEEKLNDLLKNGLNYGDYSYLYKKYSKREGEYITHVSYGIQINYTDFNPEEIFDKEKEEINKRISLVLKDLEEHGVRLLERTEGK